MKTKNLQFSHFLFVLIWTIWSCQAEPSTPTLDFQSYHAGSIEEGTNLQLLLKMSILNYDGDIIKYGLSTPTDHQQRLNYYISGFQKDIFLVTETDTIPCIDSHFERLNMDLPYRNFILNFNHYTLDEEDHLLIRDKVYTNQLIKLSIQKSNE